MDFKHRSILLKECIEGLKINPKGIYLDGTLGGGGHSEAILKHLDQGRLIGLDQDEDALAAAKERLRHYGNKVMIRKSNFKDFERVLEEEGISAIDGALLDIGVSSYQIDEGERGFSYLREGPLDMRMDQDARLTARNILLESSLDELKRIFWTYGEEKWSGPIAQAIVQAREEIALETTLDLVKIIESSIPQKALRKMKGHPAKRVFQALRIAVNRELDVLSDCIPALVHRLNPKGRLAIITFHSLEDRIVKRAFKDLARDCICPKEIPVCVCDHRAQIKIITTKPILPSKEEQEENSRARSAKLRICEKL